MKADLWETIPQELSLLIIAYLPLNKLKKLGNVSVYTRTDVLEFMHRQTGIEHVSFDAALHNLDQLRSCCDNHPVRVATVAHPSTTITDNGYLSLFAVSTGSDPFQKNDPCLLMMSPENTSLKNFDFDLVFDIISHRYYITESVRAHRVGLALRQVTSYLRQIPSVIISEENQLSQCLKQILRSHTAVRVTIESNSSRIYFRPSHGRQNKNKNGKCMDAESNRKPVKAVLQKGYLDRHYSVSFWRSSDTLDSYDEFLLYKRITTELLKTSPERWSARVGAICHLMMRMGLRGKEDSYSYDPRHGDLEEYKVTKMLQILQDIGNVEFSTDAIETLRVFICSCVSQS